MKVGDRIICRIPDSWLDGREAIVTEVNDISDDPNREHCIRVDGVGVSTIPHFQCEIIAGSEKKYITAKTFPLGEDGKFQSGPAEAAYEQAKEFGLNRDQTRLVIQAYQCKADECDRKYKAWVEAGRPPKGSGV
jgi:hypothetical protein